MWNVTVLGKHDDHHTAETSHEILLWNVFIHLPLRNKKQTKQQEGTGTSTFIIPIYPRANDYLFILDFEKERK